jgi:hypothetical protein
MPEQILIYSQFQTKRLDYILDIIFIKVLGLKLKITCDKNLFEKTNIPKFSYSTRNCFPNQAFISSHSLLFETDIHVVDIDIFEFQDNKVFFKTSTSSFFPFDIFAASFYLISRYEEYLPFKADKLGRFQAIESLAFREAFLEIPLINIWAQFFGKKLCFLFPALRLEKTKYRHLSTIDIDNAWAHLNKGLTRTCLSLIKLLVNFDLNGFVKKTKVLSRKEKDPYDNYNYLNEIHEKYGFDPIYFILYSKYARYDKNPSINCTRFKKLIKKISIANRIGFHPSFHSNKSFKIVEAEKKMFEQIVNKPIIRSRQHYLYLRMPETYENLLSLGIVQDFSMGYSSHIGFRASFCLPYHFFNLVKNEETQLEIIPFELMDVCFKDYQKIKPEIALIQIKKIISSIKNVNGLFVSLWHNETLNECPGILSWRNIFEQMLKESKNGNQTL